MSLAGPAVMSLRSQKGGLGDRFKGWAQDELLLPAARLVASAVGSLGGYEKESKKFMPEKGKDIL